MTVPGTLPRPAKSDGAGPLPPRGARADSRDARKAKAARHGRATLPGIALFAMVLAAGIWTAVGYHHSPPRSHHNVPSVPAEAAVSAGAGTTVPALPHQAKPTLETNPKLRSTPSHPAKANVPAATTLSLSGPGALPQTTQFPTTDSRTFSSEMKALWLGIKTDSLAAALPAFFPEAAYMQVKDLPSPRADYLNRLLIDYQLDVSAAHRLLGTQAAGATLVDVAVPSEQARWIYPGDCYNNVGYFQVAGSRLVYRVHGQVRSFVIASLISWRGVWYVVHLGAISRPTETGFVDDPVLGPGTFGPPEGC